MDCIWILFWLLCLIVFIFNILHFFHRHKCLTQKPSSNILKANIQSPQCLQSWLVWKYNKFAYIPVRKFLYFPIFYINTFNIIYIKIVLSSRARVWFGANSEGRYTTASSFGLCQICSILCVQFFKQYIHRTQFHGLHYTLRSLTSWTGTDSVRWFIICTQIKYTVKLADCLLHLWCTGIGNHNNTYESRVSHFGMTPNTTNVFK